MRICAWPCGQAQTPLLLRPSYDEERRRSRRTEGRPLSLSVQFSTARNVQFSAGVDRGSAWVYRDHGGSHGGSTVCARVTEFCIARERPYFGPGKRWVLFAEVRRWHRSGGATARLQAAA